MCHLVESKNRNTSYYLVFLDFGLCDFLVFFFLRLIGIGTVMEYVFVFSLTLFLVSRICVASLNIVPEPAMIAEFDDVYLLVIYSVLYLAEVAFTSTSC